MIKTVLLAEDNKDDLLLMTHAWRKTTDDPLQTVKNGREAIDYLQGAGPYNDREQFPVPILLLLDLKMPILGGFAVLKWLRQESDLKELPVVILTASAQQEDVKKAYLLGANSYLVKPSEFASLLEMLKDLRKYWFAWNLGPQ